MKITILGSGYVGLVTGACLAEVGNTVLCIDTDYNKISRLQQGQIPIYEPGLENLIRKNSQEGRLSFSTDISAGVAHGLLQFIAVGTPPDDTGAADLKYVLAGAASIAEHMQEYRVIITKSTVPVGTADRVRETIAQILARRQVSYAFDVASNPEFLKEGAAIADFMKPDRIVVGTDNAQTLSLLRELYAPFNRNHDRLIEMDVRSAELTKYAANALLATKISFMNELSHIAERVGADIEQVRIGIGSDPRIGYQFIYPGAGYGGSCFPKDVTALARTAQEQGYTARLLYAVEAVNQDQKQVLFQKIQRHYAGQLAGKIIALWGLAFKPNTDDMREAPSRTLIEALWAAGASVRAYDPAAMPETQRLYPQALAAGQLTLCTQPYEAIIGADALAIITEWQAFRSPDFEQMRQCLKQPVIFDGRNLYDIALLQQRGFIYYAIGRGTQPAIN